MRRRRMTWSERIKQWEAELDRAQAQYQEAVSREDEDGVKAALRRMDEIYEEVRSIRDPSVMPTFERELNSERPRLETFLLEAYAYTAREKAAQMLAYRSVTAERDYELNPAVRLIVDLKLTEAVLPYYLSLVKNPELAGNTSWALRETGIVQQPRPNQDGQQADQTVQLPDQKLFYSLVDAVVATVERKVPMKYWIAHSTVGPTITPDTAMNGRHFHGDIRDYQGVIKGWYHEDVKWVKVQYLVPNPEIKLTLSYI